MTRPARESRDLVRMLMALASGAAEIVESGEGIFALERTDEAGRGRRRALEASDVRELLARGLIERSTDGVPPVYRLAAAGTAYLRRLVAGADSFRAQHQLRVWRPVAAGDNDEARALLVNESESPIGWLAKRKGPNGEALLAPEHVEAGERLRSDFTAAHLTPRVTMDWTFIPGERGRRGPGAAIDVRAHCLAARERLEAALRAVGPGLADILLEVCCFLTGLEESERRLAWPQRSGKVVLVLALERLAMHYGLIQAPEPTRRLRAWQAANARPTL